MTPVSFPVTIYYDASCPLCASKMLALKARDHGGRLRLIDCSAAAFDDRAAGIGRSELMRAIHARDADGRWLRGVAVFEVAYGAAGLPLLARLWGSRLLRPLWKHLYPWIARHRGLLSRLDFRHVVRALIGSATCTQRCSAAGKRAAG